MQRSPAMSQHEVKHGIEPTPPAAVDLFCGAGGLTRGLQEAGIRVKVGVDIDDDFRETYEANNAPARFEQRDVAELSVETLKSWYGNAKVRILAGCAPCQPFSSLTQNRQPSKDYRWPLLRHFGRLAAGLNPDFITMENVPALVNQSIYRTFRRRLVESGYEVWADVVDCSDYGVPQRRKRLVLIASRHGPISLIPPTTPEGSRATVRDAIAGLPPIAAGGIDPKDRLHKSAGLSAKNLRRLRSSKPGGTWRDWPVRDQLRCHRKETGRSYGAVYGRMTWDAPAPTITTQAFNLGSGRFGHPEQARAISLREAALLQSFPLSYRFLSKTTTLKGIGTMIGNAVPVKLGSAIGTTLLRQAARDIPADRLPVR